MFSHTVLLRFTRFDEDFFLQIRRYAERTRVECDGIAALHFVGNEAARAAGFTHGFITTFVDEAAHDRYQNAPVHMELKHFIMPHVSDLIVLDATIS